MFLEKFIFVLRKLPRHTFNGEQTAENQARDNDMRFHRPDLHSMSFDGEISWLFLPIESERGFYSIEVLDRFPDLDKCAIGIKKGQYQFYDCFWSFNERNLGTNRETIKISIEQFLSLGRDTIVHTSLGIISDWRDTCNRWSCQSCPSKQFCLVPKSWQLKENVYFQTWASKNEAIEKIVGKNMADDTVLEDLDESNFFN